MRLHASRQFGVTATPWRGDRFDIRARFGEPSYTLGIDDGMRLGYRTEVRYRLYADNIDWDFVRGMSDHSYSIKDLNARLFLPERDEGVREQLMEVWARTQQPRAVVFCRTIEHAERLAALLAEVPQWRGALAVHADLSKRERQSRLMSFRSGKTPILTAVDILNEGVDIPDVNILCFARVTHSRRIFVQQLGRGLRLRAGKSNVEVLDFVSDIRRVAAILNIRQQIAEDEVETLRLAERGTSFDFADKRAESLMREWIKDAASLETSLEESRLQFPDPAAFGDEVSMSDIDEEIRREVIAEVYRQVDELDWDGMAPRERSQWYVRWIDDPLIGGKLTRFINAIGSAYGSRTDRSRNYPGPATALAPTPSSRLVATPEWSRSRTRPSDRTGSPIPTRWTSSPTAAWSEGLDRTP